MEVAARGRRSASDAAVRAIPARALARRSGVGARDAARRADARAHAHAAPPAARVLRWSAPAPHDRDGAAAAARADHRRRADDRARRDHPGADLAIAARAGEGARRVGALHHPRSWHRARDLRSRGGDVRGAGDGGGANRCVLRAPGPSLYEAAAGQRAEPRRRAARHSGRGPEPGGAADGLSVSSTLRLRDRRVPRRSAGVAGPRRWPRRTLPPPGRRRSRHVSAPLLEVVDLVRHFPVRSAFGRRIGWLRAVDGVSLTVSPGETLGLVGESGCGKSTLGKTVMGIYTPTAGDIRFAGREIGRLARRERRAVAKDLQYVY